jgi:hypothetical protein
MSDYQCNPNVEQWKPISGYPGYEVSDFGRVRSYWQKAGKGRKYKLAQQPVKILKSHRDKNGYPRVMIYVGGKAYNRIVSRLMLETFIGPCPPGMQCCHNDGYPDHNFKYNLRWDTPRNNQHDRKKHGTAPIGENHGMAKLSESDITEIRRLHANGTTQVKIATIYNIKQVTVSDITRRKIWRHIP